MSAGQHLPLGQAIPNSLHAVSVSIPTMADVIGYEEKNPETLSKLTSGYPRFVLHTFLRQVEAHWQRLFETPDHSYWPTSSEGMAKRLQAHLSEVPSKLIVHRGVSALRIPTAPQTNLEAKAFLQHVGGFLSARQAEDYLVTEGALESAPKEDLYEGDPVARIRDELAPLHGVDPASITLSNTGMNAFFAAFEVVRSIQYPKGRKSWIKLGWLYTDTMHILDKLSGEEATNLELLDILDLDTLEKMLEERGNSIAGIVTETPTNPLIQTCDLDRISKLATQYGIYFIVDPTVASPANIEVEPYADIIVNSLTKYAANEGDVMLGSIAVTDHCPQKDEILSFIRDDVEPPYTRDLHRLAYQISGYQDLVKTVNQSTAKIVEFLESHPKVKSVYWAKQASTRQNFEKLARSPEAAGGLISFEIDGPLAPFYDATPLGKGPSFGMHSTLLCPYIYLAHYSLVTSQEGLETLARANITPELLRLAIGEEPVEEIIAALKIGLEA
ncbi:PLP-dependent transferase [Pelagicoccus mobilis]|uniref:PLP-dependent transferase n=1 Tax=Pelagicoccus mobilis TaxID=415221 RepID=A0A934S073_9BACT|nr:PLP-dependent transferase [Pelagicoccus mobilis]MBK1879962.1 PLP-dependent transferase [Pelagicoccus mobilis]